MFFAISEMFLRQYAVELVKHIVHILLRDDERRLEGHDVAARAVLADDVAAVLHFFEHVVEQFRRFRAIRMDEFGAVHEAEAAHVADDAVACLEVAEARTQLFAALSRVFAEVVLFDIIKHGEAGCRRHGVAAERRGAGARVGVGDFCRRDEARNRRAVAERFRHAHDVRHDAEVLDAEHLARAREARLDFVDDQQRAVLREDFLDPLEIAFRRHDDARVALDGLGDERARMAGGRGFHEVFDGVRAGEVAGVRLFAERAAIAVRVRREMDAADRRRGRAPHREARDAHAELCAAVEALPQRDDLAVAVIDLGEQQRAFRRLGARRAEEALLQGPRRDLGQTLGEVDEVFREVDVADMLQLVHLRLHGLDDVRVAVAAVHDGDAGIAVEVLLAIAVPEILHRAFDHFLRVLVEMGEAGHDVFFLLLNDGRRADKMLFAYHRFCPLFMNRKCLTQQPPSQRAMSLS